ncbi:efflux RND transporter periplasmic adaptor subunit [bacterium]|nr:efflux RND transporter periplasmic adaptor subunit [bacterium]
MKKKGYIITGIALAGAAVILVSGSLFKAKDKVTGKHQSVIVTRRDVNSYVLATGIIKPMVGAEVRVGSRISGIVKQLHVNIGNVVEKGQIIAEVDPAELQAKYNQAEAATDNARINCKYAQLDLDRQKPLFKQNLISQNQLDLASKAFEINNAQYKQAKANLTYAGVQLGYTQIVAPIAGVIATISTQEGETIAASFSAPTFMSIINLDRLEVWAYVDETDIGRIQVGHNATFTVDTYMDTDFEGTVTAIYPKAVIQDNVVNYIVTIKITDFKEKVLRPEMTTTLTIYLETREKVLTVPRMAVQRQNGVYMVAQIENGQPVQTPVKTGWSSNDYIEIRSGLQEGDEVLLNNINRR